MTVGSYLLDAETKVSGAAGSIYYGGTGAGSQSGPSTDASIRPSTPEDEDLKVSAALAKLSTPDRKLAEAQKICPIQGTRLGTMGTPVKLLLNGQPVFLCCKGCEDGEDGARKNPEKTLRRVEELKQAKGKPPTAASSSKETRVKAALAKLSDEDRNLAAAQKYCAIEQGNLLGSMGTPVKIMVQGKPVFLCCAGCEEEAKSHPDQTLATVEKLKAKVKAEAPKP